MHDLRIGPERGVTIAYPVPTAAGAICDVRDRSGAYVHGVGGPSLRGRERSLTGLGSGDRARVEGLGAELRSENEGGEPRTVRVAPMDNGKLTVDANDPLAGSFLNDEMTVTGIRPACVDKSWAVQRILKEDDTPARRGDRQCYSV